MDFDTKYGGSVDFRNSNQDFKIFKQASLFYQIGI